MDFYSSSLLDEGVGLHPTVLQGLCLPSFKTKDSNRDINGLMDEGAYTSEARSWSDTPPYVVDGRQDMVAVFASRGRGDYQL